MVAQGLVRGLAIDATGLRASAGRLTADVRYRGTVLNVDVRCSDWRNPGRHGTHGKQCQKRLPRLLNHWQVAGVLEPAESALGRRYLVQPVCSDSRRRRAIVTAQQEHDGHFHSPKACEGHI